jgi:hypothetical protein
MINGGKRNLAPLFFYTFTIMNLAVILLLIILVILLASFYGFFNPKFDTLIVENKKRIILWYNGYKDGVAERLYIILF